MDPDIIAPLERLAKPFFRRFGQLGTARREVLDAASHMVSTTGRVADDKTRESAAHLLIDLYHSWILTFEETWLCRNEREYLLLACALTTALSLTRRADVEKRLLADHLFFEHINRITSVSRWKLGRALASTWRGKASYNLGRPDGPALADWHEVWRSLEKGGIAKLPHLTVVPGSEASALREDRGLRQPLDYLFEPVRQLSAYLGRIGKFDSARPLLERALLNDNQISIELLNYHSALDSANRRRAFEKNLDSRLFDARNPFKVVYNRSTALFGAERFQEAITDIRRAAVLDPQQLRVLYRGDQILGLLRKEIRENDLSCEFFAICENPEAS